MNLIQRIWQTVLTQRYLLSFVPRAIHLPLSTTKRETPKHHTLVQTELPLSPHRSPSEKLVTGAYLCVVLDVVECKR